MKRRYAALFGFFFALATVHAIVAFWTPVQADDWAHWIWAGQHPDDEGWVGAWLASHHTFSDVMGYVLARHRTFHVLVTPMVIVALVIGLFVLAMRRAPKATLDDLLLLALASALVWLGQPVAGVTLFHTPHLALYVYGTTVAIWVIAPFRCGWHVPRGLWPLFAIAGYCAGSSTRAIGLATLVGIIIAIRALPRERRATWMWIGLGGVVVGCIVGYATPPWIEFARVFRRGLEQNLAGPDLLRFAMQETGELIACVAMLVFAQRILVMFERTYSDDSVRPDPAETLRWLLGSFAVTVWSLFGPRYNEATLFPITCMIVVAALPWLVWVATSRPLRYLLIALVVVVHAVAWGKSLVIYHRVGHEGFARLAAFERAKPGTSVLVPHYSQIPPAFWFFGEDLAPARLRQLLAVEAFGLRAIELAPFRRLEPNPGIELALEVEGVTAEELAAARPPAIWATELAAARRQFELFARRLRKVNKGASARLVVKNIDFSPGQRPLLAAWLEPKAKVIPRVARSPLDANSRYTIRIYGNDARRFSQAWIVDSNNARETEYRGGAPRLQPLTVELNVVIVCNAERCLAADAFVPAF